MASKKPQPSAPVKPADATPAKASPKSGKRPVSISIFAGQPAQAAAAPLAPAPEAPATPASDAAAFVAGDGVRLLPLAAIVRAPQAQPRARLEPATVETYREAMAGDGAAPAWGAFPPVVVFGEGDLFYLADGFHRLAAAEAAGLEQVRADVRPGDLRDAILFSVGANAAHGLPRTNEDKRRAAFALLTDADWGRRSDRWIADQAAVSNRFVSNLRAELARGGGTVNASQSTPDAPTVNASQAVTVNASQSAPTLDPQAVPDATDAPPPAGRRERIGRDGRVIATGKIGHAKATAAKVTAPQASKPSLAAEAPSRIVLPVPRSLARLLAEAGYKGVQLTCAAPASGTTARHQKAAHAVVVRWAGGGLAGGKKDLLEPRARDPK